MEFINKIATYSPVPAGGAAVANSFCLAVALIYKTVLFELERNDQNIERNAKFVVVRKELEHLLKDAQRLVEADSEAYMNFVRSKREGDTTQMTQHFSDIIEVSMKILEKSEAVFEWIQQLRNVVPRQMMTHLLVAGELLMGAVNGTVHVAKDNIRSIRVPEKRANYLKRLTDVHQDYRRRYQEIMSSFLGDLDDADIPPEANPSQ